VLTKTQSTEKVLPMQNSSLDLTFPLVSGKEVVARFDGGEVTSDAGLLLVARADRRLGLTDKLAAQIVDRRDPWKVAHSVGDLLRERIYGIAAGYEDANDLDTLGSDPALLVACGKRVKAEQALGSQPTISRFENSIDRKDLLCVSRALAGIVISQLPSDTKEVVLDVDATDDPCHGQQEFELFNGFYDEHCYIPLYLYVTGKDGRQRLLAALLRPGNASSKVGLFGLLRRAVELLRARFPKVRITLRADSGFGDGEVLSFCEAEGLSYVLGLSSNQRLRAFSSTVEEAVAARSQKRGADVRSYTAFHYAAKTWEHERRVICKAETVRGQLNVRYVVTDRASKPKAVYKFYCQRGDRENRIKEMKIDLASGRTSCHRFWANQFRLLLHTAASVLMSVLQEAVEGTRLQNAQAGTLRLKLIKIGARVQASCRRIWFHLPTSCPMQDVWSHVHQRLAVAVT
jgi:hypothetical protein